VFGLGVAACACGLLGACGGAVDDAEGDAVSDAVEATGSPTQPPAGTGPRPTATVAATCIRGGTPREDVRRIMGEPDSVSFGVWLYGSSEITFGYGVVVEMRDSARALLVC
jgi:hypothetical protein